MANLLEDIQCAGSDTRPPMLDRTDFASWQQRIRLYCQDKENGVNILESIDEGPFQMGTIQETLAEGNEGALHLGPERPRVYSDMSPEDKERCSWKMNSKFVNNMLPEWGRFVIAVKLNRILRESNYDQLYAYLTQHEAHANENKMMLDRFTQHTVNPLALMSNVSHQQYYSQPSTTPPSTYVPPHFVDNTQLDSGLSLTDNLIDNLTNILALLTQSYKIYLPQTNNQLRTSSNARNQATVQDARVVVHIVQGEWVALDEKQLLFITGAQDNAIDEDAYKQPVQDLALTMDNVFQADDCDAFDSDVDEAPTTQTMFMANLSSTDPVYDEAGLSYDSDIISEYVKDNAVPVVQSNVSSIPNDAYMMILNDMHEQPVHHVSKENEKLRIVITDRNIKEENLKKELHSVKMQLTSTIYHNKSMVEEVTSLKKDFKQKENKYLEEFLDMKALKEEGYDIFVTLKDTDYLEESS
ncbi:hypothetical protein Tco_0891615 [Tanacetum coccineum]|uniref:Integrase, catalytic region, zinc finger, CCHC-type, peptidase aspartic, catalytic n=1 Tax=Tanacetum coccineum TaxID=301880 RepID=A0ABQ5C6R9_9ASTR